MGLDQLITVVYVSMSNIYIVQFVNPVSFNHIYFKTLQCIRRSISKDNIILDNSITNDIQLKCKYNTRNVILYTCSIHTYDRPISCYICLC